MRAPAAMMALTAALAASAVAQDPTPGRQAPAASPRAFRPTPPSGGADAKGPLLKGSPRDQDDRVYQSGDALPEPVAPSEIGRPTIALPTGPIEPFLLRKEHGPFMVKAHVFHGPDSPRMAQALAMELRQGFKLDAYVFYLRFQPGRSNIRNVPPTAPDYIHEGQLSPPEGLRATDEAVVLVGNCKTVDEAEDLRDYVKKLHPRTLDGLPSIWNFRKGKGLKGATMTTNPYAASQHLFPGKELKHGQVVDPSVLTAGFTAMARKPDPLVKELNKGRKFSIFKCPGPYTIQVADFSGRSFTDDKDPKIRDILLKPSPLAQAASDAEKLAENLTKCRMLPKEYQPYVYHDRFSSKVCLGAFQSAEDPGLAALLKQLPMISSELALRKFTALPLAPASTLTEVPKP